MSPLVARNALAPAGRAAHTLADLGWPILIGFCVTTLVMWVLLAWVTWRKSGTYAEHEPLDGTGSQKGGLAWPLWGGFVIPAIAFTACYVATLAVLDAFPREHAGDAHHPEIRMIGHQWWWDVEYVAGDVTQRFNTANELHVPVGRPVEIQLSSEDVIHSFWVPRLHGKVDLIPGHENYIRIQADRAGVYPGECAEFCGMEHAMMRFVVVAEPESDYQRWLSLQRAPGVLPQNEHAAHGLQVFMNGPCITCHTIRGTDAHAIVGPDLTHLGSRKTIGAGSIPKDLATLHAWIVNAPSLKPGVRMPPLTQLTGEELHDLVQYLEGLQ